MQSLSLPTAYRLPLAGLTLNVPWRALLPSILLAVPKKRSSYRVKRTRQTGKSLKNLQSVHSCEHCGGPLRAHHICLACVKGAFRGAVDRLSGKTQNAAAASE